MKRTVYTDARMKRTHAMIKAGMRISEIARELGLEPNALSTNYKRWRLRRGLVK